MDNATLINSFPGISLEEKQDLLKKIESFFDVDWLNAESSKNPIPQLWKKNHWVAVGEFLLLAHCLEVLDEKDKKSVLQRLKNPTDPKAVFGMLFELLTCRMLKHNFPDIRLAGNSQPGFDALSDLNNNKNYFSCVSMSKSEWEKKFNCFCVYLHGLIKISNLKNSKLMISLIYSQDLDEESLSFDAAIKLFKFIYSKADKIQIQEQYILDKWIIILDKLSSKTEFKFYKPIKSYSLLVISEEKNLMKESLKKY